MFTNRKISLGLGFRVRITRTIVNFKEPRVPI